MQTPIYRGGKRYRNVTKFLRFLYYCIDSLCVPYLPHIFSSHGKKVEANSQDDFKDALKNRRSKFEGTAELVK